MFAVEDFRDAPMRTLATAETAEGAHRAAAALGITGHEFIRPIKGSMADAVEVLDMQPELLFRAQDAEERADEAEAQLRDAEDKIEGLHDRLDRLHDERDALDAKVRKLTQPSLPTEAA